jgi:alpha-L-fucosidase
MSHSFGFNSRDTDADYESVANLVSSFVDTVSKNGNLLLNVGPRGDDAQIPGEQIARLKGFGGWLRKNGEAVYGTRPWTRAEGKAGEAVRVRFTTKPGSLYLHLLDSPAMTELKVEGDDLPSPKAATVVATGAPVRFDKRNGGLLLRLEEPLGAAPAHAIKLVL